MHRLSGIACAVLIFALPLSASASGFFETLGISFALNVQETKAAFARAGVKEFDFTKDR